MNNRTRGNRATRTLRRLALLTTGVLTAAAAGGPSYAAGNAETGNPKYPALDGRVIEAGVIRLTELPAEISPFPKTRGRMDERWTGRDWDRDWDRGWRDRKDRDGDAPFLPTHVEFYPALDPAWRPGPSDQWRMDRDSSFGLGYGAYLNRVDGFSFLLSQEIVNEGWVPTLRFYEGFGFQSEEWSGAVEGRIHPFHESLSLGARWADETAAWPLPRQAISASENFVAAFMTREDFADYLRRESRSYFAEWSPFRDGGLQLAYLDENHESRRRRVARWGIFGGDEEFASNPEVEEGDWRSLRSRFFWLKHSRESVWGPRGGLSLALDAQWTGGRFGGDRGFTRLWGEHRGQFRLTPAQGFGYRLTFGGTVQGDLGEDASRLPRQWQFQAGGVGTLRGHDFQEFHGDRLALASLEYGVDVGANVAPVLFVDGGMAWNESTNANGGIAGSGPMALDGGIGLLLGADGLRIDIARDLRKERARARVTVRLANSF